MGTYYIWLTEVDEGYEFYDTVYGTQDDLSEALRSWNNTQGVTVIDVTE